MILAIHNEEFIKNQVLEIYFFDCKERFKNGNFPFFKYDYKLLNGVHFILFENNLPPLYLLGIVFALVNLFTSFLGVTGFITTLLHIATFSFTVLYFFWSPLFIKMILRVGLKKVNYVDKIKFLTCEEGLKKSYFVEV